MWLILILCGQWMNGNIEAKQYFPPPGFNAGYADSFHEYDVLKYEVAVRLPMNSRSLSGVNTIKCRSRQNGLNLAVLHARTLTIDSIRVDGVAATYSTSGESLRVNLPQSYDQGDSFYVKIGYHGSWTVTGYQTGLCYWPRNYNSNTLHVIAYSLGEPWDARQWMPCYDEPFDKADQGAVISVTVPAVIAGDTLTTCANGQLTGVVLNPDSTKTFTWQEASPIPTYLMHFGVSRFAAWSQWYHPAAGDSIEIREFVWPNDSVQSLTACQHMPEAMALFDSMYGAYPFHRYGQDAVYPYAWGGMEHIEQTTIHRQWILYSSENGMAHEMSHQWWGDMVTCVDFRDIWLNEGCATYSDANYNWYRFGHANFITTMLSRASDYFNEDASYRRPLYDPPLDDIFSWGYTYCKASWVMHMLRYLDQAQFFNGLQMYRDTFAYGAASTGDIDRIFSHVYGSDLSWFFDEWIYGQGHPEYHVYWNCAVSGSDYQLDLSIHQNQTNAPVFHLPVEVLVHMTSGDTLFSIPITGQVQIVQCLIPDSATGIEFDPDTWILKRAYIYHGVEEPSAPEAGPVGFRLVASPSAAPILEYNLSRRGPVSVAVFDVAGRCVRGETSNKPCGGTYQERFEGLACGIYFVRLDTPDTHATLKMTIVR